MIDWSQVKERESGDLEFYGAYRDHEIQIEREGQGEDWYIIVTGPNGGRCYDGWWEGSEFKPVDDAVEEAVRGAMIDEEPAE